MSNSYDIPKDAAEDTNVVVATGLTINDFYISPTVSSRPNSTDGGTLELRNYNSSTGSITVGWTSGVTPDHGQFPYARGRVYQNGQGGGDPHIRTFDGKNYTL